MLGPCRASTKLRAAAKACCAWPKPGTPVSWPTRKSPTRSVTDITPRHSERLAAYWGEALGGPAAYTGTYGDETSVVRLHSGNGAHAEMDRRAIACFDRALEDVGLSAEPLRSVLYDYFAWATTTTMARFHESADDVPAGLRIPHWSWDGLVPEAGF
jgi:hemoglobin